MQALFVWGTGRSGSTTILQMLNLLPCISLSGENGDFMQRMQSLSNVTQQLDGRTGAWLNHVDHNLLIRAQEQWIQSMTSEHLYFWGFKEIRTNPDIPIINRIAPSAKHIINYRQNITAQLGSQFHQKSTKTELVHRLEWTRASLRGKDTFDLPLEEFTTSKFNSLLQWLNINCTYKFVLHMNNGGYSEDRRDALSRPCKCYPRL